MKVEALKSFSGAFSMYKGEIKECSDKATLDDLLKCGYVKKTSGGKKNEGKRTSGE